MSFFNLFFGGLFLSLIHFNGWGQLTFFGDLYVGPESELHIAFDTTYFNGGVIHTETSDIKSLVSFGSQSQWEQLNERSFVQGRVRIYHTGTFTFPLGANGIFSPITLALSKNTHSIQIQYQSTIPSLFFPFNGGYELPQKHFWGWETTGETIGTHQTYWFPEHELIQLRFDPIPLEDLHFGILISNHWKEKKAYFIENPFNSYPRIDLENGSGIFHEPIHLSKSEGITFLLPKKNRITNQLVSQVITPNNDGWNDTWKITGHVFQPQSRIQIYNQHQEVVHQHLGNYQNDWNGWSTILNEHLVDGGYCYTIDLDGNGEVELKGWIYIKRN
ncbi:MAG: gliding motility-associated C-terminal domain-containing protein [Flavobacteriaceae bacterium]